MKQFEYQIQSLSNVVLDNMGQDGWELVAVSNGFCYFKREKQKEEKYTVGMLYNAIRLRQISCSVRLMFALKSAIEYDHREDESIVGLNLMSNRNFGKKTQTELDELINEFIKMKSYEKES